MYSQEHIDKNYFPQLHKDTPTTDEGIFINRFHSEGIPRPIETRAKDEKKNIRRTLFQNFIDDKRKTDDAGFSTIKVPKLLRTRGGCVI